MGTALRREVDSARLPSAGVRNEWRNTSHKSLWREQKCIYRCISYGEYFMKRNTVFECLRHSPVTRAAHTCDYATYRSFLLTEKPLMTTEV